MTDKTSFDIDAALAALAADERPARPVVSGDLQARVLGDAGQVAAEAAAKESRPQKTAAIPARAGGFRLFGMFDSWSGAAVTAVALCLLIGLGIGYGAGAELMAHTGIGGMEIAASQSGGFLLPEDML